MVKRNKVMPEREKRIKVDKESHRSTVLHQLNEMRETKEQCDFTIIVGWEEIFAHTYVLMAGSEYFRAMLTHDTKEKQTGIVTMEEAEPTCVKKCIGFIYTGKPPEFEDDIEPLLYVASLMQLSTLCDGIVELLGNNLELESLLVTWGIADWYDREQLVEKCVRFALENIEDIAKLDVFVQFDKSCIQKLLNSAYYGIPEEIKLRALVCWVRFDLEERVKVMDELLKLISLSKTNVDYLLNLLKNEPLINEDSQRKKLFSKATTKKTSHIAIFDPRLRIDYLQKFNPNDGSYKRIKKVNEGVMDRHFSAVCVGSYIYVLKRDKSVYRFRYLVKSAAWERMEDMLDYHGYCPPAVVIQNVIYVIGGHKFTLTKSVETYDTSSGTWTKLADKPQASENSTPVVLNGQIYCCGGRVDGEYTNAVGRFNPDSAEWSCVAPMNEAKGYVAAVAFHEKLYVLGGHKSTDLATVECYDLDENSWTLLKPMKTARSWFQSFVIKGEIYAVGGYFDRTNSIEKYNPEKNVWVDVTILGKIEIKESVKIKIQRSEMKRK